MSTDRVRAAMAQVDRADFLPPDQRGMAHVDRPLRIGHGATCSQPSIGALMLEALDPRPGNRVLDVGSGSGWTTALLAHLVRPGGWVVGVELEPELARTGAANLAAAGVVDAEIHAAQAGALGWPQGAPFDRILVSAAARRRVPDQLTDQLADGGLMVVPVGGRLLLVERTGEEVRSRSLGHVSFVPLR